MSAREGGALPHALHSPQRGSTSTTSEPLASQRRGCRKLDPQRGHMVMAATVAKLRAGPDGRPMCDIRIERPITRVRTGMESPTPHPDPTPQDSLDAEQHVVD